MRYAGSYKSYKLYSVTEQDIAESGGAATSRLLKNDVLVFLPDIERPEIGLNIDAFGTIEEAKAHIDDLTKQPMQDIMENAMQRAAEKARINAEQNSLRAEEERRKEYRQGEYERKIQ